MKKKEFLKNIQEILVRDEPCLEDDNILEYEEFDSIAKVSLLAFWSRAFGEEFNFKNFKEIKTIRDLIKLAGDKIEN